MKKYFRYLKLTLKYFKITCIQELAFRFSFFTGIIGSFVFVILNWAIVYFLMQKVTIGRWTEKEMIVLLGCFYIVYYAFFLLFWRGFIKIPRNIRDGVFDYFLMKPIDLQFSSTIMGGGIHNFFALCFGFFVLIFGINNLGIQVSLLQIVSGGFCLILALLNFYSLMLILISLNFKYGFMLKVMNELNQHLNKISKNK